MRLTFLIVLTLCFALPTMICLYFASQIVGNTSPFDTTVSNVVDGRLPAGRTWLTVEGRLEPGSLDVSTVGRYGGCRGCTLYLIVDPDDVHKGILVRSQSQLGEAGTVVSVAGRLNGLAMEGDWLTWAAKEPEAPSVPSTLYLDTTNNIWEWTIGMGLFGVLFAIPTAICGLITLAYVVGYLGARKGEYVGFVTAASSYDPATVGPTSSAAMPVTVTSLLPGLSYGLAPTRLRDVPATLARLDAAPAEPAFGSGGGRYRVSVNGDQLTLEIDRSLLAKTERGWIYLVGPKRPAMRLRLRDTVAHGAAPIVLAFKDEADRDAVLGSLLLEQPESIR